MAHYLTAPTEKAQEARYFVHSADDCCTPKLAVVHGRGKYMPSLMEAPCNAPLYAIFASPQLSGKYGPTATHDMEMAPTPEKPTKPAPASNDPNLRTMTHEELLGESHLSNIENRAAQP